MRRAFRNTRLRPRKANASAIYVDSPEVAEVLHAARNGHISISRQRALISSVVD